MLRHVDNVKKTFHGLAMIWRENYCTFITFLCEDFPANTSELPSDLNT